MYAHKTCLKSKELLQPTMCVKLFRTCGSADGYYENDLHCWDIAGGDVIVREAGGVRCSPLVSKQVDKSVSHANV